MAELVVKVQGRAETVIALNQKRVVVGRADKADLCIEDNLASRSHCQFVPTSDGHWLINDMDSRNGTHVNGESIKKKILEHNDKIQIGHTLIRYVEKPATAESDDIYALAEDDIEESGGNQDAIAVDEDSVDLGGLEDEASPVAPQVDEVGGGGAKAGPGNQGQCPNCNANMDRSVIICVNCGYNFNTGHVMATAAAEPPPAFDAPVIPVAGASQLEREIDDENGHVSAMDKIRERWGPIAALVVGVFIQAALLRFAPAALLTILIGLALRTVFLMATMLVIAKIVGSSFGSVPMAILKAAGIMSMVTTLTMLFGFAFFIFMIAIYVATLGGLLYVFFDLDGFEIFMLMLINYVLENFVIAFIIGFFAAATL